MVRLLDVGFALYAPKIPLKYLGMEINIQMECLNVSQYRKT